MIEQFYYFMCLLLTVGGDKKNLSKQKLLGAEKKDKTIFGGCGTKN